MVLTHREVWMERGVKTQTVFVLEKTSEENKLEDISGTAGSKQHLVQRHTGKNRHDQHIPKLAKPFQITLTYRKEFGHYVAMGTESPFGLILASEVSITVLFWALFKTANICGSLCM